MPTDNELIWEAVDGYFQNATDDRQANIRLAQPALNRWHGAFLFGLCSGVANHIEKEGAASVQSARMGMSDLMLNLRLFSVTKLVFKQWSDIVSTLGSEAGKTLVSSISVNFDEDERALNALMLANHFVDSIKDAMQFEVARIAIETHLRDTVGTSCKMAFAWALYNMRNKKPWEEFVFGGHFVRPEHLPRVRDLLKHTNPALSDQDVKDMICKWYGAPELYPVPVLDQLTSMPLRWGVLEVLALDLASGGRQFKNYPNWQRK